MSNAAAAAPKDNYPRITGLLEIPAFGGPV
jgi:hypothetical protein